MRILIVGLSRYSAPTGICRYADMLCRALSSIKGVETTLAIGSWQEGYFREAFGTSSHSKVLIADIRNDSLSRNCWYSFKLPAVARLVQADLVHLAYPVPMVRQFHCPTVVTLHDLYPFEVPENFAFAAVNRAFLRMCLRRCDGVICISRATLKGLTQFIPNVGKGRLLTQIYNPISLPEEEECEQPLADIKSREFVLSVGQHRPNKNLDLLQRTFALLRSTGEILATWKLVIVGSEDRQTAELRALTHELGLAGHVLYLSSIKDSQLAWLYKNCAIAVFPSSYEGLCMPVVEALLRGARVVCSDIPTLREVGMNSCTYFQLQTEPVESLARALAAAIVRPAETAQPNNLFKPADAARQIYRVYQSLIRSAPSYHA